MYTSALGCCGDCGKVVASKSTIGIYVPKICEMPEDVSNKIKLEMKSARLLYLALSVICN